MDRYAAAFAELTAKKQIGFCPFAVLGDPDEKGTLERIRRYIGCNVAPYGRSNKVASLRLGIGADFLELGIPFSDPVADGPVIQTATERALKNGMTPKKAIALIKKIRKVAKNIPIGILTYANISYRYGINNFYRDLAKAGADSVLLADVSLEEIAPFADAAKKNGLHQIIIVSEYTDNARLKKIEKVASGFLYVVSALGVTGARSNLGNSIAPLIRRLKQHTDLPLMVGFGISKAAHFEELKKAGADGAIVGSALYDPNFRIDSLNQRQKR
jgi:tryptophan synthase alpha chain